MNLQHCGMETLHGLRRPSMSGAYFLGKRPTCVRVTMSLGYSSASMLSRTHLYAPLMNMTTCGSLGSSRSNLAGLPVSGRLMMLLTN
eukprot:4323573-Amphidinium_carterae.1